MGDLREVQRRYKRTKRLIDTKTKEIREVFDLDIPDDRKECMQLVRRCEPLLKSLEEKIDLLNQYEQELEQLRTQEDINKNAVETEIDTYVDTREDVNAILHEGLVFVTQLQQQATDLNLNKTHNPETDSKKQQFEEDVSKLVRFYEQQSGSNVHMKKSAKLPEIELPKFSGDIFEWASFYDLFTSVVDQNADLDDTRKLQYLKSLLTGEAAKFVSNISLSNENYHVALKVLKDQYEDSEKVVNRIHSKFINIKVVPNEIGKLREFYAEIEGLLRSLEALGESVDHRHHVNIILSKLPKQLVVNMEGAKGRQNKWTLENLRKELHEEIYYQETADIRVVKQSRAVETTLDYDDYSTAEGLLAAGQQRPNRQRQQLGRNNDRQGTSSQVGRPVDRVPGTRQRQPNLVGGQQQVDTVGRGVTQQRQARCVFCAGGHWSDDCSRYPTVVERRQRLTALNLCFRCAKPGHVAARCLTSRNCYHCRSAQHHSSICRQRPSGLGQAIQQRGRSVVAIEGSTNNPPTTNDGQADQFNETAAPATVAAATERHVGGDVLLQTATTTIANSTSGQSDKFRLFFDTGSNRTYMRQSAADRIELKTRAGPNLSINTFMAASTVNVKTQLAKVQLSLVDGPPLEMDVIVVPTITNKLKRASVDIPVLQHISEGLRLADSLPVRDTTFEVDVLIGNDYYLDIVQGERIRVTGGLYLLSSHVGWILSGRMGSRLDQLVTATVNTTASVDETALLAPEVNLQDLWSLERLGITDNPHTTDDDEAMKQFQQSIRLQNGRYEVGWPWKHNADDLPTNYGLATGRLRNLLGRLSCRPTLKSRCNDIILQQETTGIIEKVKQIRTSNRVHYLPFHPVETPTKTTTKVRLVYDASARTTKGGLSLNDCLHRGPVCIGNLVGLLLRFRLYPTAIVADIEKAFHQISLRETDRDVTRFIWLKDVRKPPDPENLQVYRFCRVAFGMKPSPFLLQATVAHHLQLCGGKVAHQLKRDMYVDNLVTGVFSNEEGQQLYKEGKEQFQRVGMNLREWMTNSHQLRPQIPSEDQGPQDGCKVLGMTWDVSADQLGNGKLQLDHQQQPTTKRQALSLFARAYDPLGLVSPITVRSRMLLQRLTKTYKDWDTTMSIVHQQECEEIRKDLATIHQAKIPRHMGLHSKDQAIVLACFCDASSTACCAAVYARVRTHQGVRSNLIFAKTRVAPIQPISIPRMELVAMLMGVRAGSFVAQQLCVQTTVILFGDSQCVLHWIRSPRRQCRFVENRLKEIRKAAVQEFRYVDTKDNPADLGTKGVSLSDLKELWWEGPKWLKEPKSKWPEWKDNAGDGEYNDDERKPCQEVVAEATLAVRYAEPPFGIRCEDYSNLGRLLRVTAWCNRWIAKLRRQRSAAGSGLVVSASEIATAQFLWERHVQAASFGEISRAIAGDTAHKFKSQLGVRWDQEDPSKALIRCYGRLANAELSEASRFPILLPQNHPWTVLVIQHTHEKAFHVGPAQTLALLRKRYWVPRGRLQVTRVTARCRVCKRHGAGPYALPNMPELPLSRVSVTIPPYTNTGLDYFGPVLIKGSLGQQKVWIALFTCLTVRAVHLDLVSDMTAEQFLMALRRFFARCGTPSTIICDNAPHFKATGQAIAGCHQQHPFHDQAVKQRLANDGIKWNFIPAFAPWQGGVYERMVQLVKRSLRKAIGKAKLTRDQLETYTAEVARVVNSRPLVYVDDDVNHRVITPLSFCRQDEGLPLMRNTETVQDQDNQHEDPDFVMKKDTRTELIELWNKGERLINQFWKVFVDEYVQSLRERTRYAHQSPKITTKKIPKIGDVVIVKEASLPRCAWKIARIQSLKTSHDGLIRSAKVRTPNGKTWERPINLLVPLECQEDFRTEANGQIASAKGQDTEQPHAPQRDQQEPESIPQEPRDAKEEHERIQPTRAAKGKAKAAILNQVKSEAESE